MADRMGNTEEWLKSFKDRWGAVPDAGILSITVGELKALHRKAMDALALADQFAARPAQVTLAIPVPAPPLGARVRVNGHCPHAEWIGSEAVVVGLVVRPDGSIDITTAPTWPYRRGEETDGWKVEELDVGR